MCILLTSLIIILEACEVRIDQVNIYPTQEENYILPMDILFSGKNLSYFCQNCPPDVLVYNTFETIVSKSNYGFTSRSISFNQTHFASLTQESTLNIYNNNLNLLSKLQLEDNCTFYNAIFTVNNRILLDCYDQNILQFLFQNQNQLILIQDIKSPSPISTKMRSIFAQKQEALLYAQYYWNYSSLTLFVWDKDKDYYQNTSSWQHQIVDFDVSDKGFIYILVPNLGIYQVVIDEELKFKILTIHHSVQNLITITIGTSVSLNSQWDTLIITNYDYYSSVQKFVAWENSINFFGDFVLTHFNFNLNSLLQVQISQYFLIIQQDNYFTVDSADIIYQSQDINFQLFKFSRDMDNITQIYSYLDPNTNRFYEFSNQLTISTLQNPQLKGTFASTLSQGSFIISAFEIQLPFLYPFCKIQITYNVLPKNDCNIYQVYNQKFPKIIMQNSIVQYAVDSFSGPLQKINANLSDPKLGEFVDQTFELLDIQIDQQQFDLVKLFYFHQLALEGMLLVGTLELNLYFYICQNNYTCIKIYNNTFNQKINFIEISFYFMTNFTVAIDQGSVELIIIQVNYNGNLFSEGIVFTESIVCCQPFRQFLLTYNNLVILTPEKRILITSFTQDLMFTLDEEIVNQLFFNQIQKRVQFDPQSISTNQQNQASTIYINNRDCVLIIDISYNNSILPISIIFVDYEIYSLNLVNEQLIISNLAENNIIEFNVYKTYNIYHPEFQKELPPIQIKKGTPIYSDDTHLYVLSIQNDMVVYSPALPYHSSLFYSFKFYGNYFSCADVNYTSFITFSNTYYLLHIEYTQQFISNNVINATYISQLDQIFAVTSALNYQSQQFYRDTLYIINPLTDIQIDEKYLTYEFQKADRFKIELDNLFNFQILQYQLQLDLDDFKKTSIQCTLNQYFQGQQNQSFPNFTILVNVNNQFFILSNSTIIALSSGQQLSYPYYYNKCLASASYQNYIYTICLQDTITFLMKFQVQENNITQIIPDLALPLSCQIIKKMIQFQNLSFVLGQNIISSKYEYIYIYNLYNLNNVSVQNISCTYGIQDFSIQFLYNHTQNSQIIAIFFICHNQLYYKLGCLNLINNTFGLDRDYHNVIFNNKKLLLLKQTTLLQIIPLALKFNEILLALTTTNVTNFIFTMTFSRELYVKNQLQLQDIVQSIPPYGNYTQQYFGIANKGIMMLLFTNMNERILAIYNYTMISSNIRKPLMMMGGLNQSLPNPQGIEISIVSNHLGGQIIDLTNGVVNTYNFSNSNYITCQSNQAAHSDQQYILSLSNSFSSDTIYLFFQYNKEGTTYWIYILLTMVIISVLSLFYVYRQKIKEKQNDFGVLSEEFEL